MAKRFSAAFYSSSKWRRAREYAMKRDKGLCQECLKRGIVTPAELVHHIVPLNPDNIDDPSICTNPDNLVSVCRECHSILHGYKKPTIRVGLRFNYDGDIVEVELPQFTSQKS